MAWWYRQYAPNDRSLQALEEEARRERRGLWADPNPIPPWDFRHGGNQRAPAPAAELRTGRVRAATERRTPADAAAVVYVTRTGKKYHRAGCRYLSINQTRSSRQDAEMRGLTPCSVCRP